ncbi:cupredoxin domain-containing protein [Candidatus Woesearchaeota archaeon]|nr:cupredoxin domain-containing protein [Candidatus Woesearchaeota archaeon]
MQKRALMVVLLLVLAACANEVQPVQPRPMPNIDISIPSSLPDRPRYEPPPTSPTAMPTVVRHEIEATRAEFLPSEIKVKKGTYVKLVITAVDVAQRFTMPTYGVDEPLPVGQDITIEFLADREGSYTFYSEGHKGMEGRLVVTP